MCKVHIMIAGYMHSVSHVTFETASLHSGQGFVVFLPGSRGAKIPGTERAGRLSRRP
jgi:hypothetical protein